MKRTKLKLRKSSSKGKLVVGGSKVKESKVSKIRNKTLVKLNEGCTKIDEILQEMFCINVENSPLRNLVFGRFRDTIKEGLGDLAIAKSILDGTSSTNGDGD